MNKKLSYTIILTLLFYSVLFAQCDLSQLRVKLNNESVSERIKAIDEILDCKLSEAMNDLESRIIIEQDITVADYLLDALNIFHSPNIVNLAHYLIDNVTSLDYQNSEFALYLSKLESAKVLFDNSDYSTAQIVLDYLDRYSNTVTFWQLEMLDKIIHNLPNLELEAKNKLESLINSNASDKIQASALEILCENYGSQYENKYLDLFLSNDHRIIRESALDCLLGINYPGIKNILYQQLRNDDSDVLRINICKKILNNFGEPVDLKTIVVYQPTEQVESARELMSYLIQFFIPPELDSSLTTNDKLNKLIELVDTVYTYTWLGDLNFSNELKNILTTAKTDIQNGDSLACSVQVKSFHDLVDNVYKDSLNSDPRFVTIEGWKFLYWNAQYILDRLPEPPANPNLLVNLKNSMGVQIPASNVQYYESNWQDAVNNGDGTFTVITTKPTVSMRVYYEYASQQADNVTAQKNTYTFQTVNAAVQLRNSLGNLIDEGTVKYYAGAWRDLGTTTNGIAQKELLPNNYSFRMTYEYGSNDKQQDIDTNPTVVFQTVNAAVQLKNSLGAPIDQGTVQYYSGGWRDFGTTSNGVAYKELLPNNYSFRMTYEYGSNDKQQDIGTNPTVVFQTVNAAVQLKNSFGNLIDVGTVQYYTGAWRTFGTTTNGAAHKELLPNNYSFRMTYEYVSNYKQQNLSTNPVVDFNTVLCSVKVSKTNNNQPLDNATAKYYSGAWRDLGTTNVSGIATKELLPKSISFRATYGNVSQDKQQDISVNNLVEILLNVP